MDSERSSASSQIPSVRICELCRRHLPAPHTTAETLCDACRTKKGRHRVYMFYMLRDGWFCQFLEQDLKTPLPKKLHFKSQEKLWEIAERGGFNMNLEARQSLDHGIEIGRGGMWLDLSEEQYRRLKHR
ncbi:hypothetical protein [Occallatibacter riparius]|uniref:Uncharacterized protein n=1 Tax=Occallatibacter riparius TaxID=1002689 RepID=A0A9J7BWA4_9BACT|nr:hypothetical protein [Occallatibacter riparius]UWZ85166.1 hypothetical protein MOP44_04290 [Occallatibacter riparius]